MRVYLIITALFGLCAFVGCGERSGIPLRFILPNDYRGLVQIIEDSKTGLDVEEQAGHYTYTIPAGGQLRVTSLRPFQSWHKESATFQNGAALLTGTDDSVPESVVAFRELPETISNGVTIVCYFVGTQKEAENSR